MENMLMSALKRIVLTEVIFFSRYLQTLRAYSYLTKFCILLCNLDIAGVKYTFDEFGFQHFTVESSRDIR
jgi:hypothetical protein